MRSVLMDGVFRADLLIAAALLNALYIAIGVVIYIRFFNLARARGLLLQVGE